MAKTLRGSGFNPDYYTQFGITYGEYHNCPQGDHEPHVVSYYETVRYGVLEKFCVGRNSKTVTSYTPGSAEYPSILTLKEG